MSNNANGGYSTVVVSCSQTVVFVIRTKMSRALKMLDICGVNAETMSGNKQTNCMARVEGGSVSSIKCPTNDTVVQNFIVSPVFNNDPVNGSLLIAI